ncbi:MAG: hypothetical protein AB7I01_18905, partial [Gammaproteobacteria bacterium]
WASAAVLCRRGLHGGVLAFYDERTQWDAMRAAIAAAVPDLRAAGCVPYKSGKLFAEEVRATGAYFDVLQRLKAALDPDGRMAPGNLGLGGA